ncbi:MAG TPA: hypothetical protein VFP68_02025 [Burkholderiaceae bacterium]|nr:hypothetical protein [Burkholderiaceae bacterium]
MDNLFPDDRDEAQVLVDYGDMFLEHFQEESGPAGTWSPVRVKAESESGQEPLHVADMSE